MFRRILRQLLAFLAILVTPRRIQQQHIAVLSGSFHRHVTNAYKHFTHSLFME